MAGLDDILNFLFGEGGDEDVQPPEYVCDDDDCYFEIPIELAAAFATQKTLDCDRDDFARLCMYMLRDLAIPISSAPAAILATAAELKKQVPWLENLEAPAELHETTGPAQKAILYRWYADLIDLHGDDHVTVTHAENPDWVRGQKPEEVNEQLLRDGYERIGDSDV